MRTVILMTVLGLGCGVAAGGDELIEQLDKDYKKLLAEESNPQPLREAARLLEGTNQSSRWTDYSKAVRIIRKSRSKAAIPLLLKYAVRHAGLSSAHVVIPTYGDTLVILTGADITLPAPTGRDRAKSGRDNAEKLVRTWWGPKKGTITTDLEKMNADEVRRVTTRVAKSVLRSSSYDVARDGENPEKVYYLLSRMLRYSSSDRPYWCREDLHAVMVPHMLAIAGYSTEMVPKAKASGHQVPYRVVPLLAALRKDGQAPHLDKTAQDLKQPEAVRLTCILAVHAAGEEIQTNELLLLLEKAKRLAIRVPAILALEYSRDGREVTPELLAQLEDRNAAICTAAAYALSGPAPVVAVPKLKKIIDKVYPPAAMYPAIRVLGKIKAEESGQALADFMDAGLKDAEKARYLSRAMYAFRSSTGCTIRIPAGIPREGVVTERVQQALAWWADRKR